MERANNLLGEVEKDFSLIAPIVNPEANDGDLFGFSLAAIDHYLLVGAPLDDVSVNNEGSVYWFDANTEKLLLTINNPDQDKNARFGWSIAVVDNQLIVGAPGSNQVYGFDRFTGQLLGKLNSPDSFNEAQFGWSLAVLDKYLLVGTPEDSTGNFGVKAGSVHVFNRTTGKLITTIGNPEPNQGDNFGNSIAIVDQNVLIGAPNDNTGATNAGSVYLFSGSTGELLLTIHNPEPEKNDNFGYTVAAMGNRILVGARDDNTGAFSTGSVYVFDSMTGELLLTINNPDPDERDSFGRSLIGVEDNILIGSRKENWRSGAAYLFDGMTGELLETITHPESKDGDLFSHAFALVDDQIAIAAIGNDTGAMDSGTVYLFEEFSPPANPHVDREPEQLGNQQDEKFSLLKNIYPETDDSIEYKQITDYGENSSFDDLVIEVKSDSQFSNRGGLYTVIEEKEKGTAPDVTSQIISPGEISENEATQRNNIVEFTEVILEPQRLLNVSSNTPYILTDEAQADLPFLDANPISLAMTDTYLSTEI